MADIEYAQSIIDDLIVINGLRMLGGRETEVDISIRGTNVHIEDEANNENVWEALDHYLRSEEVAANLGHDLWLNVNNQNINDYGIRIMLSQDTLPIILKVVAVFL